MKTNKQVNIACGFQLDYKRVTIIGAFTQTVL